MLERSGADQDKQRNRQFEETMPRDNRGGTPRNKPECRQVARVGALLISVSNLHDLAALRPAGGDADRTAIERRNESRLRHLLAHHFEQRFKPEIKPAAKARIVVTRQIE